MKRYILYVSTQFPKWHSRAGEYTGFLNAIEDKDKIHTCRGNLHYWQNRAKQINAGNAYLSVCIWTGQPYRSSPKEIFKFYNLGIEELRVIGSNVYVNNLPINATQFAYNDGLNTSDFFAWMQHELEPTSPAAIIHFTPFRYVPANLS